MKNLRFLRAVLLCSAVLCHVISCSVKNSEEETTKKTELLKNQTNEDDNAEIDSDGDRVNNKDEKRLGRNPYVANLPEIRTRFLQNYKITVKYRKISDSTEGEFVIDTKTNQNDPDFKYRVGQIFIRNESFKNAARVGRFPIHSWGHIEEKDLSWVKFPDVSKRFSLKQSLKFEKFFDHGIYEVTGISIEIENSLQLKSNSFFTTITNPTLNFYYYDYEKESFEQVGSITIKKHFHAGINEVFSVNLDNISPKLIHKNYFKKGEFIISELFDYEIPQMNTSYQSLLKSVKTLSIPVVYNTPLDFQIKYVAVGKGKLFSEVLNRLFDKKYRIEGNELIKIYQFESNLPDYTYLNELKDFDKNGKWFVLTNRLDRHYLDYNFKPDDIISMSYITGRNLVNQVEEKKISLNGYVESSEFGTEIPLGNVTPRSFVDFQIKPLNFWGELRFHEIHEFGINSGPGQHSCRVEHNIFEEINTSLIFEKDYTHEFERIILRINNDEFKVSDLINEKKIIPYWLDNNIHLKIPDISKIKEINNAEENIISIKLFDFTETTWDGINLVSNTNSISSCTKPVIHTAIDSGLPVYVGSKDFATWEPWYKWDNNKLKKGFQKTYFQRMSVGISSIITNYFN